MKLEDMIESYGTFRAKVRQILYDNLIKSNPGWTDEEILEELSNLVKNSKPTPPTPKMKAYWVPTHLTSYGDGAMILARLPDTKNPQPDWIRAEQFDEKD